MREIGRNSSFGGSRWGTFVCVDGFDQYYGALTGTPWKGLDLVAPFGRVLQPHHQILTVKYFTARM